MPGPAPSTPACRACSGAVPRPTSSPRRWVRSLGGRVQEVRLDRIVEGAYAATVEVDGPQGVGLVDARSSDALNLAVLTDAPVFVSPEMLADCIGRQEGDSAEAVLLQRAIAGHPMSVRKADP